MKLIVPIVGLFAVLAVTLADGKEDVKMADLAKELAKAREETKEIIQRENDKLRKDADKLREEDEKIKKDAEKIKKENQRLRKQDAKLQREMAKQQREMAKLRRDNSEIKKTQRQKDQNNTLELQHFLKDQNNTLELRHFLKDSLRQKDFSSELKKLMTRQIDEYLQENKICVTGVIVKNPNGRHYDEYYTVNFGHTFARVPSFSASLMGFETSTNFASNTELHGPVEVNEVTESSATMWLYADSPVYYYRTSWIACL